MYAYDWDPETGGLLLRNEQQNFSKEPRPVYYKELDILGFDRWWNYAKEDDAPYLWAEANSYFYRGTLVAKTKGGSLYTPPEIQLLADPEPNGLPLRVVDIPAMTARNQDLLQKLADDAIQRIYNVYIEYKKKVDVFHVSYSGGKDSEVTLDLVQRAIPHNDFFVVFGDTGMEFPDTYCAVRNAEEYCKQHNIQIFAAKSNQNAVENWKLFGPPSQTIRWCCSVHKTAPQLLKLREVVGKTDFREMAFVGVRGDESVRRNSYDYISFGTKHSGQFSFNPILDWSSAEVYLYIFLHHLQINETYKKGNPRAGCLICPMSADKADYMRNVCYGEQIKPFMDIVAQTSVKGLETDADTKRFIETGGWKLRNNGRDIYTLPVKYSETQDEKYITITVNNPSTSWLTWIKTIGSLIDTDSGFIISYHNINLYFSVEENNNGYIVKIKRPTTSDQIKRTKYLKQVFRKAAYCVQCQECVANCNKGCIKMNVGTISISDNCIKCGNCHDIPGGCLLYRSLSLPKGNGKMSTTSLDHYADHAPKMEWITEFFQSENQFFEANSLGSTMNDFFKRFLRDAELTENGVLTEFAYKIKSIGLNNESSWALMLVNLAYTSEVRWYIKNIKPHQSYTKAEIIDMLIESGAKERASKSIAGAYKRILALPFGADVGLGNVEKIGKDYIYTRFSWQNPDPVVILYSLYKFAEACGDYYQFTLTRLLNHEVDSDGVSPTEIFGLGREEMERILTGLSTNYPEFINASFTLGLDNITLRQDKTSQDVLALL